MTETDDIQYQTDDDDNDDDDDDDILMPLASPKLSLFLWLI